MGNCGYSVRTGLVGGKIKRDGGRTDTSEKLEKDGFGRLKGRTRRRLRYSKEVVQPNTIKN